MGHYLDLHQHIFHTRRRGLVIVIGLVEATVRFITAHYFTRLPHLPVLGARDAAWA
ncbi:hypothetical protein HC891_14740 [Candidatus Gracilibacteria bacterium]|nr:hypothetical protein [Candidatus Gracilibacteria bacterium]